MEIEVPRRFFSALVWALLIVGPLLVGLHVTPATENGRPLLLTPRLARLNKYRREVAAWVKAMKHIGEVLTVLLDESDADPFDQNSRVNRVYQQTKQVVEAIDRSPVPTTFEPLHELLEEAASAHQSAAVSTARWVNEPNDENQQAAGAALSSAGEFLERLYANPWIELGP
jgi:hypothetical protein